jgi:aspartate racemase
MKKIGLIGGTGWISTKEYYRLINETINKELGGLNFAECILYSFNYADLDALNKRNDMQGVYRLLVDAAKKVIGAGAECLVLCANTLHYFADELAKNVDVPLIHIATATAEEIKKQKISKVGLLGTKVTMEMGFYRARLERANIEVLIPEPVDREFIHNTIINELLRSIFHEESKGRFLEIIGKLDSEGAGGIILGCTEIPLIIKQGDAAIPLFDTLLIHSRAAADFALGRISQ